jgi:predicted transcriptional regulator/DNA-binding XRE family transcriptional regulator
MQFSKFANTKFANYSMPIMAGNRIFSGAKVRALRGERKLRQHDLAKMLGISAPYLSQIESDDRPLTAAMVEKLSHIFTLDWHEFEANDEERMKLALREAMSDPLFEGACPHDQLARFARQHSSIAQKFVELHQAYRRNAQRLEMLDDSLSAGEGASARLPWEEVRDWFHFANNYVDELDQYAEDIATRHLQTEMAPSATELATFLEERHQVRIVRCDLGDLRLFDPETRVLSLDMASPSASIKFQLAHQIALISLHELIDDIVARSGLKSPTSMQLLKVGLANYAAGAILMPYGRFRQFARDVRHDIERIARVFQTSFEQTCHRLSTLQRVGQKGLPVFFCRVDMAGNITKRHSATQLQFARFGGACPLWVVHEAVAIPDRIHVQLAETPDGSRYVSMARGMVKPSGRFDHPSRRYAVALGCELKHADAFIYADAVDLRDDRKPTKIGISCRICPRNDCEQRAYPPSDTEISVSLHRRGIVPYDLK